MHVNIHKYILYKEIKKIKKKNTHKDEIMYMMNSPPHQEESVQWS